MTEDIKTRGSITGIILIIVAIAIALFAGYYWGAKKNGTILETINDISQDLASTTNPVSGADILKDVKNLIATSTPQKETPKAPVGKLYTDPDGDFSFRYPENYVYEKEPLVPGEMGGYQYRFYEKGADKNDVSKSFVITRRHLETYLIVIGVQENAIGCVFDLTTHAFKLSSSYSGKSACTDLSPLKNNNGTTYFSSSRGNIDPIFSESFISEKKDIVVTLETFLDSISYLGSSFPASVKNLITQTFTFK